MAEKLIRSKALEANISRVELRIDPKYEIIQDMMSKYYGLKDGLKTFLEELSHPFQNWQFIVKGARTYGLDYFHLMKNHPKGDEIAGIFSDIFITAIHKDIQPDIKIDAADNLILFLQKVIRESSSAIRKFIPFLNETFHRIRSLPEEYFSLFVKSYYQVKKLAEGILQYQFGSDYNYREINLFLIRYYQYTCNYWLNESDPLQWFLREAGEMIKPELLNGFFDGISHHRIKEWYSHLSGIANNDSIESESVLKKLIEIPGYNQIVEIYRDIPSKLLKVSPEKRIGNHWKVIFLLHIMNISGLSVIHEEALREINRTLSWLIDNDNYWNISKLMERTFSILKERTVNYPSTALNLLLNMGYGVYKTDEIDIVNTFIHSVLELGFQTPSIGGVGNDWKVQVNPAHIQNIRTWLELISIKPKWSGMLISDLIIHLALTGVYIKDTDLFPRDITKLLNSNIRPVYNLVKQLARLFPTYFNDIGAEGELRDVSTRLDELSHRKDLLIHFLRKQSHVESSNQIIGFMEETLNYWKTKNKEPLKRYIPPSIFGQLGSEGVFINEVHQVMQHLEHHGLILPMDILTIPEERLKELIWSVSNVSEIEKERVYLAAKLYKLLYQKYTLSLGLESEQEIAHYLEQFKYGIFPDFNLLLSAISEKDALKKLNLLLEYLEQLKEIILSENEYEIREDIYHKRHVAVDIPSMYGRYHEVKFDALGLTFRIESLVNRLFEDIIRNFDFNLITKATFHQIHNMLKLFDRALKLEGIHSVEFERQLDFLCQSLEVKGFTFTQYNDIFKGFSQGVKYIITDYFHNVHEQNLKRILSQVPCEQILPKYLPKECPIDPERQKHRISEIFFRDRIATSLGLQQLDVFISKIMTTLFQQSKKLPKDKLHQLLLYDPQKAMTSIADDDKTIASGIIYLGNKGYNLVKLKGYGLPIPPGFIITTEVFRCRDIISSYGPAYQNYKDQIAQHIKRIEAATGKVFGDPTNPLLFSVRSGSSISQPGMMDTFLNVGINEEIAEGLAKKVGNPWFAWDNYRRYLQCYGMSFDMERNEFDTLINAAKDKYKVQFKRNFTGSQMRETAMSYKAKLIDAGIQPVEDPFEQLIKTIERVFASWDSEKARVYRKIMGISDDWGTAVTVQAMVFGNISRESGTGVFFTHNPRHPGDIIRLWGDFTIGNQGEDVVSGLVTTMPISIHQQEVETRETDITLETHFPDIYKALKKWAVELIEKKGWGPQEMEFTFESPFVKDLYILQTRDMAMREIKTVRLRFDHDDMNERQLLGQGIGVSGGAMSGRAVYTVEEIEKWREIEPGTSLILLRNDTVPDDIREIFAADGLLTARGGLTSHAAVVAHRLNKTCVVGCVNLVCKENEKISYFNTVEIKTGDFISIDGQDGTVYQGFMKVQKHEDSY